MKEIIIDLRNLEDEMADNPGRIALENLMYDYAGSVAKVRFTKTAPSELERHGIAIPYRPKKGH